MHGIKRTLPVDPVVRFETAPSEQMQVACIEFRKCKNPLYAFCTILGFSCVSFIEFDTYLKVETLIAGHQHACETFSGITRRVLHDNMRSW
jgi:transposase